MTRSGCSFSISLRKVRAAVSGWMGWSLTFSQKPQNFYLDAVFTPQTCSGADVYGLVFRAPDTESGYFFGVTCDGRYNLRSRDFGDGVTPVGNVVDDPEVEHRPVTAVAGI